MVEYCYEDGFGKVVYWMAEELVPSRGTIFFLHGLTADHTMFEKQISLFKRFYNILTWDAPAHGRSRPYEGFTYGKAAECLNNILDRHGIESVILVGQSMGGFISQSLISRYPERVRAFISIDSTPYGDYYSKSDKWWLRQVEWMAGLFPDRLLRSAMASQTALTGEGRENMRQMLSGFKIVVRGLLLFGSYQGAVFLPSVQFTKNGENLLLPLCVVQKINCFVHMNP